MTNSTGKGYDPANMVNVHIDPARVCELCGGPIVNWNVTGVCRTRTDCRIENARRRKRAHETSSKCKVCEGPVSKRNTIGICRVNDQCRVAAKKEHDHRYHLAHKADKARRLREKVVSGRRPHRQTATLPEDGIIDRVAVQITVAGTRKVALTQRERLEATRQMLLQGASIREMCDHLHVQPRVVRMLLDELGYECVRNEHIVGSKIMVILPKDRVHGPKILPPEMPMSVKPRGPGRLPG